jgi:glycosyltransferase involved in cell wall biosynthesis
MGLAGSRLDRTPDAPLRVVMVVRLFFPWIGGTERQAHRLAQQLVKQGVEVRVVTGRWFRGTPRRETVDGIEVFRNHGLWEFLGIKGLRKLGGYLYILTLVWHLWRTRHGYDVIHVHALNYHTFAAVLAGRLTRRPVIVKIANSGFGSDIEKMKTGQQLALSHLMLPTALRSDRFVAVNRTIVGELVAVGVPTTRIIRIPNGVDISRSKKERTYELHDPVRLTFVGRLHEQKGVDVLLQALRQLRERRPGVRLCLRLVGDGPSKAELVAIADRNEIAEDVEFLGDRDDVAELLEESDIFVLPSRAEGLSNALLEAMSGGLPVVVSNIPGNDDVIEHEDNGLLFTSDDPTSLTSELMRLLDDMQLRQAIGRRARVRVQERYGLDVVAQQYARLYHELLPDRYTELRGQKERVDKGNA